MKYEGEWKNRKRHGKGALTYANGSKYEGNWKNNRMHGFGIKTYIDKRLVKYIGEWKDGHKHGKGIQYFTVKEWYKGEWKNGKMHGQGIYKGSHGRKLQGEWNDGRKHGPGTEIYPDGKIFNGEWENGIRQGKGTLTYPDGTKITGVWANNILIGSSEFHMIEFEGIYKIANLCRAINADINISLNAHGNTKGWLNELLKVPNLYEKLYIKSHGAPFSAEIETLLKDTRDFRNTNFAELNSDRKKDIKRLNRLLIEHFYPQKTPKVKW